MLELTLFGPGAMRVDGAPEAPPPPKEWALLAYLALRAAPVPRRELAEVLWEGSGTGAMRVALSRLRGLPGSDAWLRSESGLVEVVAGSDVGRFEAALAEGDGAAALTAWPDDAGDLLAGLELRNAEPFMAWLETERARLRELRSEARRRRLEALEREGSWDTAMALARALIHEDALDESAHRALMRLLHAAGDDDAALQQFEQLRRRLLEDLGVEPLPETLAELARIEGGAGGAPDRARALRDAADVPARPRALLGREADLATVERALAAGGRTLLHAAGGMGKSALAAEVAARWLVAGRAPVVWIQSGDADPATLFDALAAALDARDEVARAADPGAALAEALTREGAALVVLDDAWNAYAVARVREALPEGCALLVTSRQRYPGLTRVTLGRLERPAARALLETHAGRSLDAAADALCALLGDHPFAVRIAGVALAPPGATAEALADRVRAAPHALALPEELSEPGRGSVAALLEVSLEALPDDAHEALMAFGALAAPVATPELLGAVTRRTPEDAERALTWLHLRALAERLTEAGSDVVRYRIHDLTHSLARANSHVRPASAERASLRSLSDHAVDHALLDADLANTVHAIRGALERGADGEAVRAMTRLTGPTGYFNARGHTPASLALLERCAQAAEPLDAAAAQLLHVKLGNARRELLRDLEGARSAHARAAELAHALGDRGREAIARSLVGAVTVELGEDGEPALVEALALARASGDDLALAHALQNLGFAAGLRGRHDEAVRLSEEAVEVADRLGDGVDPQEADHKRFFGRFNLGVARWYGGDPAAGRRALEDALRVARERSSPAWEAFALQELAALEDAVGERDAALTHARAALAGYRRHRMRADAEALEAWLAERGEDPSAGTVASAP